MRLQLKVRDDITQVSNMTNQLEWMRKQLEDETKSNSGKQNLISLIADGLALHISVGFTYDIDMLLKLLNGGIGPE